MFREYPFVLKEKFTKHSQNLQRDVLKYEKVKNKSRYFLNLKIIKGGRVNVQLPSQKTFLLTCEPSRSFE